MTARRAAIVLLVAIAAGCHHGAAAPAGSRPAGTACPTPVYRAPDPHRPRYALDLRIDPPSHTVRGSLAVVFTPDIATGHVVFRLWANGPVQRREGAAIAVSDVTLDGAHRPVRQPDPTTLVLDHDLAAGHAVHVHLRFRLTLPQRARDRISQRGDTIRLGSFFPILPWVPGHGWATDPPTHVPSEASTSPVADFTVRIHSPRGLGVVATGVRGSGGIWRAQDVRDFAIATGDFSYVRETVRAPRPVAVTIAVARGVHVDASQAAALARHALQHLSGLYGTYPWPVLTLAFGPDIGSEGIEYPTMVFEGPGSMRLIAAHEIAHQWFYSLVGNDQAADPWLDEGLASYAGSETSGDLPVFTSVRIPAAAAGRLSAPMTYWDAHPHDYFAGVYAQGVQALASFGPPGRVACALRRYVARNAYMIARDPDVVAAFASVFPGAAGRFARYGVG